MRTLTIDNQYENIIPEDITWKTRDVKIHFRSRRRRWDWLGSLEGPLEIQKDKPAVFRMTILIDHVDEWGPELRSGALDM